MERHINYVAIGGLFFVICIALVAFLLWFGRLNMNDSHYRIYKAYTEYDISGIGINTPIKYKGISIGNVKDIRFDSAKSGLVKISLLISKDIPINQGSSIVMDSQGLAGLSYLSLKQNPNGKPINQDDEAVLKFEQNFLGRISEQADKISTDALTLLQNSQALVSQQNIQNINQTLESINALSKQLIQISQNLNGTITSAHSLLYTIHQKLNAGEYDIKSMLTPTLNQAEQSLQNLDSLVQKSTNVLDKFNENPYKTLFGEQK